MFSSQEAFIAIGSNKCNARVQTVLALRALACDAQVSLLDWSHNYQSKAQLSSVDEQAQDDYQNLVVRISISCTPLELLNILLAIEKTMGRERFTGKTWQAREIDLDLLLFYQDGNMLSLDSKELTLPHPRMMERDFVLLPLTELIDPKDTELQFPTQVEMINTSLKFSHRWREEIVFP